MALVCAISNEVPEVAVVSPKSGAVFERRLLEKHVAEHGTDPVSNEPLDMDEVIEVKVPPTVRPRPPSATSIPALLKLFQDEWDAVMLETFRMRQHVETARQELSHALYQHDAACRVIARLTRERDQARQALATLQPSAAAAAAAADASAMEGVETAANALPPAVVENINKTNKTLSKARKKRAKPAELATPEDIGRLSEKKTIPGLHSASKAGILDMDVKENLVISGGVDKKAVVFDLSQEKVHATLKGHSNKVTHTVLHPHSAAALTGSTDKHIFVWDISAEGEHKPAGKISAHHASITGLSLHPTGSYVLSSSKDKTWALTDIQEATTLASVNDGQEYTCAKVHPDGIILGVGTESNIVQIWGLKDQSKLCTFEGHTARISSLAFSENGFHLATAAEDSTVKLWDLRNLKNFHTITLEQGYTVSTVNFDNYGAYLAVGGSDVRVFDTKEWSTLTTLTTPTSTVTACKFGPNARSLFSAGLDSKLRLFE